MLVTLRRPILLDGSVRLAGSRVDVSEQHGRELVNKGLADPHLGHGEKSSASPAAPASPQPTATPQKRGGRKPKAEPSS